MDVIEKKPGRSWFTWSLHAGAMFIACLIIYISFDAIFQGRVPASFRNVAVMAGEATGYFLLPLLLSWVVVTFSRRIGWLVWLVTVGFMAFGLTSGVAGQAKQEGSADVGSKEVSVDGESSTASRPKELVDRELAMVVSKANESLPMMLDRDTRADTSMAYPGLVVAYFYTFLPLSAEQMKEEGMESELFKSIRSQACGSPNSQRLLNDGVTFQYVYRGNDGAEAFRFPIASGDC